MARRYDSSDAKRRILAACVRLFLEKGYTNTRVAEILKAADVSAGSFQNVFRTKDGVLNELTEMMFSGQFSTVKGMVKDAPSPAYIYAVETALQLALTEMDERLRDVYVESYTYPPTVELICRHTTKELHKAFGSYLPDWTESDFYEADIGTGAMMRGYMAHRCDYYFTLEKKIQRFLEMSLSVYHVPEAEKQQILAYVAGVDVRAMAQQTLERLFASLSMQYDLTQKKADNQ